MAADGQELLVDIPDILMPEGTEDKEVIKDECKVAYKLAFVGTGQAGGRMAEAFWKLGYRRVCAVNTTPHDLAGVAIPDANKLVMDMGEGGAGKDPIKGQEAVKRYYEDVYDLMRRSFGSSFDRIVVCVGAGGGTGGGSCDTIIEIAHDIAESFKLEDDGPVVGALVSLPMTSEGQKVNENAMELLTSLVRQAGTGSGKLGNRTLTPLVIVDNERISKLYPNLPVDRFWAVANQSIGNLFHLFNSIAVQDSDYTTFDQADLKDLLGSGIMTFGAYPMKDWSSATAISHAIRDNLRRNVLVSHLDLGQAHVAGCIFVGNPSVFAQVPQEYLEHGFQMLSRIMDANSVVHRGIYKSAKEGLAVYTMIGELGPPEERLAELARVGQVSVKKK